ncbi:hypothetical protein K227x_32890 [Rubripirellula lacrimiformis]|uniref:Uncharacterized protein n=1 Tax=Rubripirellula lacrimiformis TaxID=1930273 RepID=A0A517NCM4_9BACT|nr:hypothetical protein [Rubripirellula lacrimiformis]QDT04892.1 hypothetical protein K227x_32890 [Rubripirellula lacrimiformis]
MPETSRTEIHLTRLVWLATANLVAMTVLAIALVVGLLPKIERAVAVSERTEARFDEFADSVQPVLSASAGVAIDGIKAMDVERLSEQFDEHSDTLLDAAAQRAKRYLEGD